MRTGTLAWCTTYWLTLPRMVRRILPSPRVPVTIRSDPSSVDALITASPGVLAEYLITLPFTCKTQWPCICMSTFITLPFTCKTQWPCICMSTLITLPFTCKTQWPCICTNTSTFCLWRAKHNDHCICMSTATLCLSAQNQNDVCICPSTIINTLSTSTLCLSAQNQNDMCICPSTSTLCLSPAKRNDTHLSEYTQHVYTQHVYFICKTSDQARISPSTKERRTCPSTSKLWLHLQNKWWWICPITSTLRLSPAKQMMTHMSKHMNTFTSHGKQMTIHLFRVPQHLAFHPENKRPYLNTFNLHPQSSVIVFSKYLSFLRYIYKTATLC